MMRIDKRLFNQLRPCNIITDYIKGVEGSVLISFGDTKVLTTVTIDKNVPSFLRGKGRGWLTAEYGMLPRSTKERNPREAVKGQQKGRTIEIQRLIGRSLRSMLDFSVMGESTVTIDCDVIQADGGTRTAAITGAAVALVSAIKKVYPTIYNNILIARIAAISVGIYQGIPVLDLNYVEDSSADTDMNLIMNDSGGIIEIQGTGEKKSFSPDELNQMLTIGAEGIKKLLKLQEQAIV